MSQDHNVEYMGRDGFIWWLGQVEDKKDPANLGRVKVRVAGWYTGREYKEKMPTENLPWAHVMQPTTSGGVKNVGDSANKLEVGAIVMGMFLDGESAQQPCVMGCIRSSIEGTEEEKKTGEWIADLKNPGYSTKLINSAGTESHLQNRSINSTTAKAAESDPGSVAGGNTNPNATAKDLGPNGATEARGVAFGQSIPASSANGAGIPNPDPMEAADGTPEGGSIATFGDSVSSMIGDIGLTAASITGGLSDGVSWVNGVAVDLQSRVDGVLNFIMGAANGLIADIKQMAAKALQALIKLISKAVSGLPLVVQTLINVALKVLGKFLCTDLGDLNSLIGQLEGVVQGMISDVVGQITNQITSVLSTIQGTVDQVLGKVNEAVSFVSDAAGQVGSIISGLASASKSARAASDLAKFADLNFTDIAGLIMAIIDMIPWRCDREEGNSGKRRWVPLYGGSQCDRADLGQRGFNLGSNNPAGGNNPYAKLMEIDPYLTYINSAPNGSYSVVNNKPGGESRVEAGPAGSSSTLQDAEGNTHVNNQGNYTQEVSEDKCTHVKKDKIENIDGDYKLKVGGNFHVEVGGAMHINMSQGKQKNGGNQPVKSTFVSQGTFEMEVKENVELKSGGLIDMVAQGEFRANGSKASIKADSISFETSGELTETCGVFTHNCNTQMNIITGMNPLVPGLKGILAQVGGKILINHSLGLPTEPVPTYTYNMSTPPGLHTTNIIGAVVKNVTGATTENYTGAHTTQVTGAYTKNVTVASTYNTTGTFTRNVSGVATYAAQGLSTISAAGPLVLIGVPILLN